MFPKTLIEPFRIKVVEPIRMTTVEEREALLEAHGYNLFKIPARFVTIDLLTDSGTGAMSAAQWAALFAGDESYAGSESFFQLRDTTRRIFGYEDVLPVHQGRAAERILFGLIGGPGKLVLANTFFDTTRANVEATGALAVDLPDPSTSDLAQDAPFKGDIDLARLETLLRLNPGRVVGVVMTMTNNTIGGQPVSLSNLRQAHALCKERGVPLYIDAARFAENAFLAHERDPQLADLTLHEIVRAYFDESEGFLLSAKKDALCHIGGLLALRDRTLAERARQELILTEGFPTYGGLAGRDLAAMAQGLEEGLDLGYLTYRAACARYLAEGLARAHIPFVRPAGLHAIYLDAGSLLDHLTQSDLPGHAVAIELFRLAGIRSFEIGTLMHGDDYTGPQLTRLALPRRSYTQSHIDYVIEAAGELAAHRESIQGFCIVQADPALRHFTARLAPKTPRASVATNQLH